MQKRDIIDVDKLERELVSALEADRKYSRENDAKFRAVHQKVATYEEFRDIVKASHLNPLDRDDITGRKGRKQPWNPLASTAGHSVGCVVSNHHANTSTHPTNTQDFMRKWRILKSSPQEQYQFLLQLGGDQLYSIFKVEVSMGLLGEMMEILNRCFVADDRDVVVEILTLLSRSMRFSLSLSFLVQAERKAVTELFDKLRVEEQAGYLTNITLFDLSKLYEL